MSMVRLFGRGVNHSEQETALQHGGNVSNWMTYFADPELPRKVNWLHDPKSATESGATTSTARDDDAGRGCPRHVA